MITDLASRVGIPAAAAVLAHMASSEVVKSRYGDAAIIGAVSGLAQFILQPVTHVVARTLGLSDFSIHLIRATTTAAIAVVALSALTSAGLIGTVGIAIFGGLNAISVLSSLSQAAEKYGTGDKSIINNSVVFV